MPLTCSLEWPPAATPGDSLCLRVEIHPGSPVVAEVSGMHVIRPSAQARRVITLLGLHELLKARVIPWRDPREPPRR
jgi:hypothetical protein